MIVGATFVTAGQTAVLPLGLEDEDIPNVLTTAVGVGGIVVGVRVSVGMGVDVGIELGVGDDVEVGVAVGAKHVGTVTVSASVETVPPNAKALPVHMTVLPMVIPALLISVPANRELAPSVVAPPGVQNTLQADAAPEIVTTEPAVVLSAPVALKIYVPLAFNVIVVTTETAPVIQ